MSIPNEDQALEYIYENHKPGALYTVIYDVVAGAIDKIKQLKAREDSA
jgi:cyanophycin synthetase